MVSRISRRISIIGNICCLHTASFRSVSSLRIIRSTGLIVVMMALRMRHAIRKPSLCCTLAGHAYVRLVALNHDRIVQIARGNGVAATAPVRFVRLMVHLFLSSCCTCCVIGGEPSTILIIAVTE